MGKLRGFGGKLGGELQAAFNAATAGQLQGVTLEALSRVVGDRAWWVFNAVRGIDSEPVKPKGGVLRVSHVSLECIAP